MIYFPEWLAGKSKNHQESRQGIITILCKLFTYLCSVYVVIYI